MKDPDSPNIQPVSIHANYQNRSRNSCSKSEKEGANHANEENLEAEDSYRRKDF